MYGADVTHCEVDGEKLVILKEEPSLVGHVLDGKYTLISKLGEGGMGSVYLAEQSSMGREVAIKVLRREFSQNRLAIKRFLREARAASKLAHPNTITVYDFGQSSDGLLYLVMERLSGRPLADILDDGGRMTVSRAVHILAQVCDSLSEAHAHGITHRDLKPENIFIEQKVGNPDFVKVLDFGIAKMQGDDSTQATATGMICGTPSYMSPEQAMGRDIDGRSDIYALGILLYEMLTDVKPFDGDTPMEVMLKHINEATPNILATTGISVPSGLQAAIDRMLSKHADARPAHCQEVKRLILEGADTPLVGAPPALGSDTDLDLDVVHPAHITHVSLEPRTAARPASRDSSPEKTGLSPAVPRPDDLPSAAPAASRAGLFALIAVVLFAVAGLLVWQFGGGGDGPSSVGPARVGQGGEGTGASAEAAQAPGATGRTHEAEVARTAEADARAHAVGTTDPPVVAADTAGMVAGLGLAVAGEVGLGLLAASRTPAAPEQIAIKIVTDPAGAKVHDLDDAVVGETPFEVRLPKGPGTVQYTLRKPGYVAKTLHVDTATDATHTLGLVKARKAPPAGGLGPGGGDEGQKSGFGTF